MIHKAIGCDNFIFTAHEKGGKIKFSFCIFQTRINTSTPNRMKFYFTMVFLFACFIGHSQKPDEKKILKLKMEALAAIDKRYDLGQQINDMLFSFSELGFQEVETQNYLTSLLEKNGFKIEKGIAGVPTAWTATWGNDKPVIALGSDVDCIPKASQKPGVAYHEPIVEGAPGHGEGHNSGQALNIVAALAIKEMMEREKIPGTLMLWPGIAEEQLGTKAYYIRQGYFKNVDACIFTHVADNLKIGYGDAGYNGMVSVKFTFEGQAAHAAGAPWRGRSALDAVELMDVGWNFKREHLALTQRSHSVIPDGGDQPNVVPSKASVWYYFRERTYPEIKKLFDIGIKMADGAALMTDTKYTYQILGSAWPGHFNKPMAETMYKNFKMVGLPTWTADDQLLAKATQLEMKAKKIEGLATKIDTISLPVSAEPVLVNGHYLMAMGGGSDDIADISWSVPTIVLGYPSNIPGLPGHHWSNAITMATPIAHKGIIAGAKSEALTLIDLFMRPKLLTDSWDYFNSVQTKETKYQPLMGEKDTPAIFLNKEIMQTFKPQLKFFYYDPSNYKTYLEQLGITYPTLRPDQKEAVMKLNEGKK